MSSFRPPPLRVEAQQLSVVLFVHISGPIIHICNDHIYNVLCLTAHDACLDIGLLSQRYPLGAEISWVQKVKGLLDKTRTSQRRIGYRYSVVTRDVLITCIQPMKEPEVVIGSSTQMLIQEQMNRDLSSLAEVLILAGPHGLMQRL